MKNKKICLLLAGAMLAFSLTACGGNDKNGNTNDMVSSETDHTTDTSSAVEDDGFMDNNTNNTNNTNNGLNNNNNANTNGTNNNGNHTTGNTTSPTVDHNTDDDYNNSVTDGTDDNLSSTDNDSLGEDIMDGVDNMMDDARQGIRNITDGMTR